jgi:hypothetical protein
VLDREFVLLVLVVLDRVVALCCQDEVGGNELSTLVEQLVERVLGVGGGLAEEDGSGSVLDVVSTTGNGLAVRLHGQLLEVSGEPVQVLVESAIVRQCQGYKSFAAQNLRRNKVSLSAEEV